NDTVTAGDAAYGLDNFKGPLIITGQAGPDALLITDQAMLTAQCYTLTSTPTTSSLTRSGAAPITWDKTTEAVTVQGGSATNTFIVKTPTPAFPVIFHGRGSMNTLVGPNLPNTSWLINGPDQGTLGLVGFQGMQNLIGGGSSNAFHFTSAGTISGSIDG